MNMIVNCHFFHVSKEFSSGLIDTNSLYTTYKFYIHSPIFNDDFQGKWKGREIYELVYKHLNLSEGEYFGIQYYDKHDRLVGLVSQFYNIKQYP